MFWLDHMAVGRTTRLVYNSVHPDVEIRDKTEVFQMKVREVEDDTERKRLWDMSACCFPTL